MGRARSGLAALAATATIAGFCSDAAAQPAVTVSYSYDALGRLATAAYSNGLTITYSYDAAGNRTSAVTATSKVVVIILGGAPVVIPVP